MMTKVQWLCWRRVIGMDEDLLPTRITIDQGNLIRREVIKSWDEIHWNVSYLMHDNWVVFFKTWRRRSLFSGRSTVQRPIQRVNSQRLFITRHTKIRDQKPSLGYICPGEPHQRSPNAPKFEDRSQEETEWQEQGAEAAREAGQKCVKN